MANRWHIAAVVVTGCAVGAAGLAIGVLGVDRHASDNEMGLPAGGEAARVTTAVVGRAEQAITAEVVAAAAVPQLRAALHNRVDAATLEDLFASEDWWIPYRDVSVAIVSRTGTQVSRPARQIMPDTEIAAQARANGATAALKVSAGVAKLVGAAPIAEAAGGPVLTFAKPIDSPLVTEWARAAGVPLAISDGQRIIAASDPALGQLPLAGHERDTALPADGRFVAAPNAIGGDLWLWVARARTSAVAAPKPWMWALVGLALVVAVVLALIGGRSSSAAVPMSTMSTASAPALMRAGSAGHEVPIGAVPGVRREVPMLIGERSSTAELGGGGVGGGHLGHGVLPTKLGDHAAVLTTTTTTAPGTDPGSAFGPGGGLRRFGQYELIERIDEGGMSDIFTATMRGAKGFERVLVIKRLKLELSTNRAAVEQFIDEARLGSQLVHPNIAQVYDFGELADGYFMALEYVPGRNVNQLVERHVERLGRGLDLPTVFYLAHDLLQALSYAHGRRASNGEPLGVVHRDVSPSNVMISTRGDVKLLDFGIVKSQQRISHSDLSNIKGNPAFMSPEHARGLPVDARSDLFSVGLVMYYALTGQMLYRVGTAGETLFQAATGPTREHLDSILTLSSPAARIIARALAVEPSERFRSAEEFAAVVAPEVRQGACAHMGSVLQSLFGYEFQMQGATSSDLSAPVRPRAI